MPSEPWEEIARRLEAASGSDRELDAEICRLAHVLATPHQIRVDVDKWETTWIPELTASVDAILALIGEKLPGWDWTLSSGNPDSDGRAGAWISGEPASFGAYAATPALALCAAFARAMAHQARAEEG